MGFMISGTMGAIIFGALGLIGIVHFHRFYKGNEMPASGNQNSESWKELAARFSAIAARHTDIRKRVRAEWYSERLDNEGKEVGETWQIRDDWQDGAARDCAALCNLAGAMLLKSPEISASLSHKVRTRSDEAWRWLCFLDEHPGVSTVSVTSITTVNRSIREHQKKVIQDIAGASSIVCIECAAKENSGSHAAAIGYYYGKYFAKRHISETVL